MSFWLLAFIEYPTWHCCNARISNRTLALDAKRTKSQREDNTHQRDAEPRAAQQHCVEHRTRAQNRHGVTKQR